MHLSVLARDTVTNSALITLHHNSLIKTGGVELVLQGVKHVNHCFAYIASRLLVSFQGHQEHFCDRTAV